MSLFDIAMTEFLLLEFIVCIVLTWCDDYP
jgi:hypothetical protein